MHPLATRAIETDEPIEAIVRDFYGPNGPLAARGWEIRSMQVEMSLDIARQVDKYAGAPDRGPDGRFVQKTPSWGITEAPCGCHAKGQGILMFDGSVKLVENIVVGDLLMGPDSTPRTVLSLARGRERMVDVVPTKGATFRVNRSHILTLVRQGAVHVPGKRRDRRNGEIIDAMVSAVIDRWTRSQRALYRLIRAGVREFGGERSPLDIPAWVLGALLGDGGFSAEGASTTFTSIDPEVYEEVKGYVLSIGCQWKRKGDGPDYLITNIPAIRRNPLRTKMRALGLFPVKCHEKHIPQSYKTASWDDRRELLAGLIDTDGSYNGCGGFDYVSKSERLARDVAFVARSLGLAAYAGPCEKRAQTGGGGTYWRVSISGNCSIVPTRLVRKRAPERVINKDPLRSGFQLVERDEEDFYGFSLDGDGRFLLDDFTITHNTGKSLAYGIVGVLAALRARAKFDAATAAVAKKRKELEEAGADESQMPKGPQEPEKFVVTTANIALQEQIVRKDIPAIAEMLGVTLDVRLLKSRQNYLCRWKIRTLGGGFDRRIDQALAWMRNEDCDGDKESVDFDVSEIWQDISATSDECLGQGCAHYTKGGDGKLCYWRAAIDGFAKAHVIVTNHHYLTLARPMRCCLLAVDEMHEFENSLRSTQARSLTDGAGRGMAKVLQAWFPEMETQPKLEAAVRWLALKVGEYWKLHVPEAPNGKKQDAPVVLSQGWLGPDQGKANEYSDGIVDLIDALEGHCQRLGCFRDGDMMNPPKYSKADPERTEEGAKAAKAWMRLCSLQERYAAVADGIPYETWLGSEGPWAIYAERRKAKDTTKEDRFVVSMLPADVSWATEALARAYPVAVLTSATVPLFPALRLSLGLQGEENSAPVPCYEKRLPSPYPLATMGVLIIPHGPSPKEDAWTEHAVCSVIDLVNEVGGGVLVLSTSIRMMWLYANGLRDKSLGVPFPVKVQGEAGRGELREWFKTNEDNGVLVATSSFFQGLDVQGDNCRCVVIDKAPFGRPDDPVENAVGELLVLRAGRGSSFDLRALPQAAMKLAQGGGRLIRAQTDRGVLVVLDKRLLDAGQTWGTLKSALPPFPVSRDLEDAGRFLRGEPTQGLLAPPAPPRGRSLRRPTREVAS